MCTFKDLQYMILKKDVFMCVVVSLYSWHYVLMMILSTLI